MTNLDNVLKNRHHFANKGPYTPSYGFSSSHVCTIKKVEHQRTWTARRSNQSIPKEINLEIGLNIRRTDAEVKVPILGHLMQRANSLEKMWMLRKTEGPLYTRAVSTKINARVCSVLSDSLRLHRL